MKIFVVTHSEVNIKLPANYELFQVNAQNNKVFCHMNDAVGQKQISEKNQNYCELTAAYWIWKNIDTDDFVGLMHYRRYLTRNILSSSASDYLDEKAVKKILNKYDFISTKRFKSNMTVKEAMLDSVREQDFNLLRQIISTKYSDYLNAFDKVFSGHRTYLFNIFITDKKKWDEYYTWLFSIFDDLEPLIDMTDYSDREKRLYGFLSERLFTVYILKNKFRVKSFPVHIVGVSTWSRIVRKVKKFLRLGV